MDLPIMPMLYFGLKQSTGTSDFSKCLEKKIAEMFHQNPNSFLDEIEEFETLRSNAVNVQHDLNGCALLKRYYAQLSMLCNKFNLVENCEIKFKWIDSFTKQTVVGDIQLELDSILHNIGALHSELGASGLRSSSDNMKIACTHFQCAAWVYSKLKTKTHPCSKDLESDIITMNHEIMLAQAQECVLEKSILDNRKPSIISKVASQVVDYYCNIIAVLLRNEYSLQKSSLTELARGKIFKEWKKIIELKISYYTGVCSYFAGNSVDVGIGEKIAWHQNSEEKFKSCLKLIKSLDFSGADIPCNYFLDLINKSLEQAKKDNNFIYHEIIPSADKLTAIKGVSLVKEISFNISDNEVAGKDIFSRLVPIEAYETVSVYSENKDQIWRNIRNKIDEKNEELIKFLSILQLDKQTIRNRKFIVPEKLVSICATLSVNPNILTEINKKFKILDEINEKVNKNFEDIKNMILSETLRDCDLKEFKQLKLQFEKDLEAHKRATISNQNLKELIENNKENILLLMNSSVSDLENLFSASTKDFTVDEKNLLELERLFDKVEEMKKQRNTLQEKLKESIDNDDILKKVLTHSKKEINDVFAEELKKFDTQINYLKQNMAAQEKILEALTRANADYGETKKAFLKIEKLRNEKVESLFDSYEAFQKVLNNIDKGIQFYNELEMITKQFKEKISLCKKNKEMEEKNNKNKVLEKVKETNKLLNPEFNTNLNSITNGPKLKDYLPYMTSLRNSPQFNQNYKQPIAPITPIQHPQTYSQLHQNPQQQTYTNQNLYTGNQQQNQFFYPQGTTGYQVNYTSNQKTNYNNQPYFNTNTGHYSDMNNIPQNYTIQNSINQSYATQSQNTVNQVIPNYNMNHQNVLSNPAVNQMSYTNPAIVSNANANMTYQFQQMNLSNPPNFANYFQPYTNYSNVQNTNEQNTETTFDSILNMDNDLSLESQPVLIPTNISDCKNKKQNTNNDSLL